jgi:hypothetical protein
VATLTQIRTGLATRLATIAGLNAYATAPGQVNVPAAVVAPGRPLIDFDEAGGGGPDTYYLTILVLVQMADTPLAQEQLDAYLPRGTGCVKTAVEGDATLGGIASWAWVPRIAEYGPVDWAGVTYLGAVFDVEVQ